MRSDGYRPIADYAIIGNRRTAALVSRWGSIDWCCLPEFSAPSVLGALLDKRRGGRFLICPAGSGGSGAPEYEPGTNVLMTTFRTSVGTLRVVDFMPVDEDLDGCSSDSNQPEPAIYRIITAEGRAMDVDVEWSPRPGYGAVEPRIVRALGALRTLSSGPSLWLDGLDGAMTPSKGDGGPLCRARLRLRAGESRVLAMSLDSVARHRTPGAAARALARTKDSWRRWLHKETAPDREWAGSWKVLVERSELTLKLLTHRETGAIAAAPTTSLPEAIGGVRNWDYRYSWIRDASMTAQALIAVGHPREAHDFLQWTERVSQEGDRRSRIQIMYGVHGEKDLEERELCHLEGYRASAPVRVGNGAFSQRQLDTYGEILDSAYELVRTGHELDPGLRTFLRTCASRAQAARHELDSGIWEMRGAPKAHVHSRAMLWVALDRAARLAADGSIDGPRRDWTAAANAIQEEVLTHGFSSARGSFVQSYGSDHLDAANLMLPLQEVVPFSDPRVQATLDATLRELTENGLVYRYHADDGLPGREGAFGLCTFWLVDALAMSGRLDEAWAIFEGIARRANAVGLFPEQFDPSTGAFLGNFPQAFTHIGLINSTLYLAHAEGRRVPVAAPLGSESHRRQWGRASAAVAEEVR